MSWKRLVFFSRNRSDQSQVRNRYLPRLEGFEDRVLLSGDVLTWHNDNARTGLYDSESQLNPGNVNMNTFGKLFVLPADGKVDAAPLYKANVTISGQGTHNVAFVATEHDTVYAYDADNGQLLWQSSMLAAGEVPSDNRGCGQVTPQIGITATPVIDPNTNIMYLIAMSKQGTTYFQRLHALDITTGQDVVPPTTIDSSIRVPGMGPGGDGTYVSFNPAQYKERDALLLVNGQIYTFWASHCDIRPYTAWVMTFSATDLSLTSVLNINPNGYPNSRFLGDGSGSAFWNSGAGPAADDAGNVYNISGNGPFDENLDANGFPVTQDYGDSYVKFSVSDTGGLAVADYWTAFNQQALADADLDLGSSGILLLPDLTDAAGQVRHLAIGSGKDGNLYLVDRDNMGHFVAGSNSSIYQEVAGAIGAEFSAPAYFNGMVYFGGVNDVLKAFQFTDAQLSASPVSQSSNLFGYPGATPSVSSNGTDSGIVWAVESVEGMLAVLHAYDANNLATELYNSNQAGNRDHFGQGNKFITPVIANGEVFVGTTNGVGVFGLLPGGQAPARNDRGFTPSHSNVSDGAVALQQGYSIDRGGPVTFAAETGRLGSSSTARDNDQVGSPRFQVLLESTQEGSGTPGRTRYVAFNASSSTATAGSHGRRWLRGIAPAVDSTGFGTGVQEIVMGGRLGEQS
jgi:hypothetical protein